MIQIEKLTINGETYAICDAAARVQDGAVGEAPWSSRKLVELLCPKLSLEGSYVSATPLAGTSLQVTTQITNSCTDLQLTKTGRQLLPFPYLTQNATVNGMEYTMLPDGSLSVTGEPTRQSNYYFTKNLFCKGGVTYTVELGQEFTCVGKPFFYVYSSRDKKVLLSLSMAGSGKGSFRLEADEEDLYVYTVSSVGNYFGGVLMPVLTLQGEDTAFAPYQGQTYSASFGKTVASGSYCWNTGELTDENGEVTQLTPLSILAPGGQLLLCSTGGDIALEGVEDPVAKLTRLEKAVAALG